MMDQIKEEISVIHSEDDFQQHNKNSFKEIQKLMKLFKLANLLDNSNNLNKNSIKRNKLNFLLNKTVYDINIDNNLKLKTIKALRNIILK